MQIGFAFWVLMLLWLVFGLWSGWPTAGTPNYRPLGSTLLLFILLGLLGWHAFGAPLHS